MTPKPNLQDLMDGDGLHNLTNSQFYVPNPYATVHPTTWDSAGTSLSLF